ncbi:type IV secretory system conjugative DNA transfer family protein [Embleya sp. NPDC059237]|uniref:type IV secretory system conjugative DNA transfer family protein n=1 Tax=Embleya sp. NPDC059237 TaxID=3346784 RepID=UPI0036ABD042
MGRFVTSPGMWWSHIADTAEVAATTRAFITFPLVLACVLLAAAARGRIRRRRHERWARDARCITILAPPRVDPSGGEALWRQLSGLAHPWWKRLVYGQFHLGFEYAWNATGLTIRLWLPGLVPESLVRRAVQGAWPGAHTTTEPAEPALTPGHVAVAGALRLARPEVLPLRDRHDADPLRGLLQAATGMSGEQQALVQILARPATGLRLRKARVAARRLKAGQHPGGRTAALRTLATHGPARSATDKADPTHNLEVRHTAAKLAEPQWAVTIRYAATTPPATTTLGKPGDAPAEAILTGRVHALATTFAIHSWENWLTRTRLRHPERVIAPRRFDGPGSLLSVPELAALAHLPLDADAPGLARAGARSVIPPAQIPTPRPGSDVKPLGTSDAGHPRAVGLNVRDGRQHLHVVGATGSGKSTLLANLIDDDVRHSRGVVVIDPKGDLITDLLHRLPASAADRLVVIDPDDPHTPPSLNVLEGDDIDVVVDNITGIFRRIFSSFWGPRTDDIMRATCLTLMRRAAATGDIVTLADVPRLLGEPAYRARLIPTVTDPVLRGFWTWYESMSEPSRAAVIGPVQNKLRAFLLRGFVRQTIAAGPSTFDFDRVLDGGICLVRVPKGALGEETTRLLGSFVVGKVWQAAARRSRVPEHDRIDASLVVDECHNFLTLPYPLEDMLAEARGYRLSMVLAHQNLAQLPADLREGISANARNKVFFQASPEDARALERHVRPNLGDHDLAQLGAYQVAARLLVDGASTPAFTLTTRPARNPVPGRAKALRAAAHRRVGGTDDPTV